MSSTSTPQTLADCRTFVANLCNDSSNARYTQTQIDSMLDLVQTRWNMEAQICRDSVTLTVVSGTANYNLSSLTGTPLKFIRITHKGIDLKKRSKQYFDIYASYDWTTDTGTPVDYYIDIDTATPYIGVRPIPQGNDAGAYLTIAYVKAHTPMVLTTDTPFMNGAIQNTLITPYTAGVCYEAAAKILMPDPTPEIAKKVTDFAAISEPMLSIVRELYTQFDADEPWRMQGGRNWIY